MPRITAVGPSGTNTATVQLDKEGLVVDERVMMCRHKRKNREFECSIEGTTLTVTRLQNGHGRTGWAGNIYFRIYDPEIETVPDFSSKSYRYLGLENEQVPLAVEEVTVDPSVMVIRARAFDGCKKMKRCIMGDNVEGIEAFAFTRCKAIKSIQLSRSLEYIEKGAFYNCTSIECLFIPPNVKNILEGAFYNCTEMKILVLPANIDMQRVGNNLTYNCHKLLKSNLQYERDSTRGRTSNNSRVMRQKFVRNTRGRTTKSSNSQVIRWLKHRYDRLPLIRLCADPDVTVQMIQDFIHENGTAAFHQVDGDHGLLPLHILTRYNPYAGRDAILACYDANPAALFIPDSEGKNPINYLWENEGNGNDDGDGGGINGVMGLIVHLIGDLCIHRRNIKKAVSHENDTSNGKKRKRDAGHV